MLLCAGNGHLNEIRMDFGICASMSVFMHVSPSEVGGYGVVKNYCYLPGRRGKGGDKKLLQPRESKKSESGVREVMFRWGTLL